MNELQEKRQKEYVANTFTASSAAYLDDLDTAFDYLEKAYNDRDPILLALKYQHWVPATLKENPRFQNFLQKIGFPTLA